MRKFLAIGVLVTMLATLTACGNSTESVDKSNSTKNSSTTVSSSSTVNKTESSSETSNPNTAVDNSKNAEQIIANAKLQYPSANDEYEYNVYDTYIEITKYIGSDTDVTIPAKIDNLPVLVVGESAFTSQYYIDHKKVTSVTSVTIPDSVVTIEKFAFSDCSDLTKIVIGNGVKKIRDSAFSSCSSLTSVIIPDSVVTIGENAFKYCKSLKNVTIGNSVTMIGYRAFEACSGLTSIIIPDNVKFVDAGAFYTCINLKDVYIYSTNCAFNENHSDYTSIGKVDAFESTATLYGYAGSTTAEYCAEKGNTFKLIKE